MTIRKGLTVATLLASTTLLTPMAFAESPAPTATTAPTLEQQFQDPPMEARPRVWWHWMNGNISKDGIAKDMAWMKRVGIGGLQNFDAGLDTPQIVDKRLIYMTPEWKDAFRFAATEADRLGLELAIAASPGWSETGGPWVKAEDGLKKVVWSETRIKGGKAFTGKLAMPPANTGPYLDMPDMDPLASLLGDTGFKIPELYSDIAVLAVPDMGGADVVPTYTAAGKPIDGAALADGSLRSGVSLPRGTADAPTTVVATFAKPETIRSATMSLPGAKGIFSGATVAASLEASDDGQGWRKVAEFPITAAPSSVGFTAVTARHFRLVLAALPFAGSNMGDPMPGLAPAGGFVEMMAAAAKAPFDIKQFRLSGETQVDQFESKAGFAVVPDYYALGTPDVETVGVAPLQVINLTGRMKADGTLDWTPPKGKWRIIRLGSSLLGTTNHPAPPEATGLEVDKFDGDAVRRYLEHYIGLYKDAAGTDLVGKRGVRAILTDSIEVGAANWTPKMIEQFRILRGYDPTPYLPALAGVLIGTREQSDRFLRDYRQTLADLMASEHYGTVAKVAHENDLKVYGEALEDNRPSLGDDMAMRSHADVPMAALWTYSRKAGPNPSYVADMKGAASVAHIYGQNLVAAESMTSALAPWAYAPNELRRIIDLEFASGVNRPVVHTSVHQPVDDKVPGLSLMIFGQFFNRHEAWAELARPWVDYMARSSLLLQAGRNVADVAYFYGEEGPLTALYGRKFIADAPVAHAYDFINRDALFNAVEVQGGEVVSKGGARYKAIQLGGSTQKMTLPTLRRLATLVEAGATVVGQAPIGSPALNDDAAEFGALVQKLWSGAGTTKVGAGQVIASSAIDEALAGAGVAPDLVLGGKSADGQVLFVHRAVADGDVWFLNNRKAAPETLEARFRVTGKQPELWHADTGEVEAVSYRIENGQTIVPLTLDAEDSVFVVFRKDAKADAMAIKKVAPATASTLGGAWKVAFQPGRGAPALITMPKLASLSEQADAGVKFFSGLATYTSTFNLPKLVKPGQPLWINLGDVGEIAEVSVNGKHAGYAWHKPYRVNIAGAVRKGTNTVEVKVANLWVNRLIGDAQNGATKVTWTAIPTYTAAAPLRPSGLIGPVTLEVSGSAAPSNP
ncbi:glycosyl hydrolase [Novosphingobium sp. MMS21-SN21R]|uniref:glycosyl hydrolase n=1 Tax=Novosphingobium sp. MMS21-SN21R TaxID=2969298 RepID=UPI002888B392|nr:glycosyl hydrolase [Novosphingobium sp. MMS21-SN21R]MDT0508288.1 glycosyl hydrolase [Novosphingobium sp. MMS21-SN21R]